MRKVLFLTSALIVGCLVSTTGQAQSNNLPLKWNCLATSYFYVKINPDDGNYHNNAGKLELPIIIAYEYSKFSHGELNKTGYRLLLKTKKDESTLQAAESLIQRIITESWSVNINSNSNEDLYWSTFNVIQSQLSLNKDRLEVIYHPSFATGINESIHLTIQEDDKDWKFIVSRPMFLFTEKELREIQIQWGGPVSHPEASTLTITGKCLKVKD